MQVQQQSRTVDEIVSAIRALDLEPIKFKLMEPEEGPGWSREYVERMEVAYKRFLTLLVTHPDTTIAPTKDIDTFWHGHILDTMKYAKDCENVFGYFLHHYPYFGLRGKQDAANLTLAGESMSELYAREFGEPLPRSQPRAANPAYCWAAKEAVTQDAAYCWAAKEAVTQDAAYCWAAKEAVTQDAAYCWAAREAKTQDAAYCWATKEAKTRDAAYCWALSSVGHCVATNEDGKPKQLALAA